MTTTPKPARKFAVGQKVWHHTTADGTPRWLVYTVAEVNPRSYVFRHEDQRWPDVKMATDRAERAYLSEGEKYERDWDRHHRRSIIRLIEGADVMTLQVVAKALGFEAAEVLDRNNW